MSATTRYGDTVRHEFDLDSEYVFVNHGGFGTVPKRVKEAQFRYMEQRERNPGAWFCTTDIGIWTNARNAIAEFVGADPENLVFVQNTTTGINTVLKAYPWQPGDEILVTDNTFIAVQNACRKTSLSMKDGKLVYLDIHFPIESEEEIVEKYEEMLKKHPNIKMVILDGKLVYLDIHFPIESQEEIVEKYEEMLKKHPNIKMVILDHMTSPTALKMPVEKLVSLCKDYKILSVIDGAHAPGHLPLNLKELDADVYTGNLHKWMFTPRGCAILCIKNEHHDWCTPLVTSHYYQRGVRLEFYMQGTRDNIPYFVVPEAIKFYNDMGGFEKMSNYTSMLLENAVNLMKTSWGTEGLKFPKSMETAFLRMVKLPELPGYKNTTEDAHRPFNDIRKKHHVDCMVTLIEGELYLRLSANIYNTDEDYKRVNEVVIDLSKS